GIDSEIRNGLARCPPHRTNEGRHLQVRQGGWGTVEKALHIQGNRELERAAAVGCRCREWGALQIGKITGGAGNRGMLQTVVDSPLEGDGLRWRLRSTSTTPTASTATTKDAQETQKTTTEES